MAKEMEVGCARPTGGPVSESAGEEPKEEKASISEEVSPMIHVGKVWEVWKTEMAFE
jgi:peroxiredoxin (alkyl hydroperoxide reductase subunit C)